VSEEITMQEWEEWFMKLLEEGEAETQMKEKQTAPEETEVTVEEKIWRKRGGWFQEENNDVREHGRECADVWARDLGIEGTGGGGEYARKISEMGARSGQRTPGYIVREECKRSRLRVTAEGKSARGWEEERTGDY
jgi:hypothetical protein